MAFKEKFRQRLIDLVRTGIENKEEWEDNTMEDKKKEEWVTHDPKRTLEAAINLWGKDHQQNKVLEEMSELSKEILKFKEGKGNRAALIDELADVIITLRQLELMYNITPEERDGHLFAKMLRLEKTIKEEQRKRAAPERPEHRVDCSLALNFLNEFNRMCNKHDCNNCLFTDLYCGMDGMTQEHVDILQKWSDYNPPEEGAP